MEAQLGDGGQATIRTAQHVAAIGGVSTELCIMEFADRYFVVLTQLNKPGTLVRAPPLPTLSPHPGQR